MKTLLVRWGINTVALLVVANVVPGIDVERWQALVVGALVLGLLNTFLRPVLFFLTLPVTLVTLGLFTLVLNGLIFYLAASLVKGFHASGFLSSFVAALVFTIVSFILNNLISQGK